MRLITFLSSAFVLSVQGYLCVHAAQQRVWEPEQFSKLRNEQRYGDIIEPLRRALEDPTISTAVLNWVTEHADNGDVPMIYLLLRNHHKGISGGSVPTEEIWNSIAKYLVIGMIRVCQDKLLCKLLGHYHEPTILNPYRYASGYIHGSNITTSFRNKFSLWFKGRIPEKAEPFDDALLSSIYNWFDDHKDSLPLPAWVCNTYPSLTTAQQQSQIQFDSSDEKVLKAQALISDIKDFRLSILHKIFIQLKLFHSWDEFFTRRDLDEIVFTNGEIPEYKARVPEFKGTQDE